jgi:hypothetical protein
MFIQATGLKWVDKKIDINKAKNADGHSQYLFDFSAQIFEELNSDAITKNESFDKILKSELFDFSKEFDRCIFNSSLILYVEKINELVDKLYISSLGQIEVFSRTIGSHLGKDANIAFIKKFSEIPSNFLVACLNTKRNLLKFLEINNTLGIQMIYDENYLRAKVNESNAVYENKLKELNKGCYIATMAYGDYDHPQVMILRQFRDDVLDKSAFGKWFIKTYYHYSPKLVKRLKNQRAVNSIIRKALNQFIKFIK